MKCKIVRVSRYLGRVGSNRFKVLLWNVRIGEGDAR